MLKNIFLGVIGLILLFTSPALAQDKRQMAKVKEEIWGEKNPDFEVTAVPEKWKNESVVVLAKSYYYEIGKSKLSSKVTETITYRKRFKILDEAAIKKYSELSFEDGSSRGGFQFDDLYVGIKIIKADGTEKEISINDAVTMELKSKWVNADYKKIAIPDLVVGDILEYYYRLERIYTSLLSGAYSPVFYLFRESNPILQQRLTLRIRNRCSVSYKALNGAPKLKQSKDEEDNDIYTAEMKDQEKIPDLHWYYPTQEAPHLKFQAFLTETFSHSQFVGEARKLKDNVTNQELEKFANYSFNAFKASQVFDKKFIDELKSISDNALYVEKAFDQTFYMIYAEGVKARAEEKNSAVDESIFLSYEFSDKIHYILACLRANDRPFEILLCTPKYLGNVENVIMSGEFIIGFRINGNTPKPIYLFSPRRDVWHLGEIPSSLQGTKAYSVQVTYKKGVQSLSPIKITEIKAPDYQSNQ
jgi:hypothetical protein